MNITPEIMGLTFSTAGEILLAITVLTVHSKLKKEHKVDEIVEKEIKFEEIIGFISIILIALGYLLQVNFFVNMF